MRDGAEPPAGYARRRRAPYRAPAGKDKDKEGWNEKAVSQFGLLHSGALIAHAPPPHPQPQQLPQTSQWIIAASFRSSLLPIRLDQNRACHCDTQALHLADTQRRVYVVVQTHLQRGDFVWKSAKATVAAAPTWDRNQHVCEFKVEALEASGTLRYLLGFVSLSHKL